MAAVQAGQSIEAFLVCMEAVSHQKYCRDDSDSDFPGRRRSFAPEDTNSVRPLQDEKAGIRVVATVVGRLKARLAAREMSDHLFCSPCWP